MLESSDSIAAQPVGSVLLDSTLHDGLSAIVPRSQSPRGHPCHDRALDALKKSPDRFQSSGQGKLQQCSGESELRLSPDFTSRTQIIGQQADHFPLRLTKPRLMPQSPPANPVPLSAFYRVVGLVRMNPCVPPIYLSPTRPDPLLAKRRSCSTRSLGRGSLIFILWVRSFVRDCDRPGRACISVCSLVPLHSPSTGLSTIILPAARTVCHCVSGSWFCDSRV